MIDLIAKIYSDDKTTLSFNIGNLFYVKITSEIRQSRKLSALLFILVTYKMIDAINDNGYGFKIYNLKLSSLFHMDDALIFTENFHETERMLNRLSFICMKYGLELNKN